MIEPELRIPFDEIAELEGNYLLGETRQQIMLESSADYLAITTHMISQASRSVRIFTHNLDPAIYDQESMIDACKKMALKSQYSRIEILVLDTQTIIQRDHRLLGLARKLSSTIEIRRPKKHCEKKYKKYEHAFATIDETAYIYKHQLDRYDGNANYYAPAKTAELGKIFQAIWACSYVDINLRDLVV